MDKYAELRAALDGYSKDDPLTWSAFWDAVTLDTIRDLLAERDALADALMAIEGMYEYDMPVGEAAMALYEASNIARAALAQGEA